MIEGQYMKIMYIILLSLISTTIEGRSMNGSFTLTSPSFKHNGSIPSKFTCDDQNISPELNWDNVPSGVKSFALISDDPDAPDGTWVHWVVFDLPTSTRSLAENVHIDQRNLGSTSFEENPMEYGGPCPPEGTHDYHFKLYALDTMLNLKPGVTADQLDKAMQGHILAQATLIGKYKRVKK